MNSLNRSVSLHPYFKVHSGNLDAARALLAEFVETTRTERGMLYYEFTLSGDVVFCREAYVNAAAVLDHLTNVGPQLERMLELADLIRLEVHGPAEELAQLKPMLGPFNPAWFEFQCGVTR